jgi:hypothetical protein
VHYHDIMRCGPAPSSLGCVSDTIDPVEFDVTTQYND